MDAFEREMNIIERQLIDGSITSEEYDELVNELEGVDSALQEETMRREDFDRQHGY